MELLAVLVYYISQCRTYGVSQQHVLCGVENKILGAPLLSTNSIKYPFHLTEVAKEIANY